jgi:hypothetical protein
MRPHNLEPTTSFDRSIMGQLLMELPATFAEESLRQELERACVTGGQDNMPYPTDAMVEGQRLTLTRTVDESGCAQTPWPIPGFGQLMTNTATLVERGQPYHLAVELARGKVNQLRTQVAEWTQGGLTLSDTLTQQVRQATHAFGAALLQIGEPQADALAETALGLAHQASHDLVLAYIERVFELRHERLPKFDTLQSCRLEGGAPEPAELSAFTQAFNAVSVPFSWHDIEPAPRQYQWETADRVVNWAVASGLKVIGGPLIDFAGRNLPAWLWSDGADLHTLSHQLSTFVEAIVRRYHARVRTWQISAGSNCAGILAQRDEELIWLTLRLVDAVRRVHPNLEIIVGLAQPWGDYLAEQERSKTPFIFVDDLLRTGVKLTALDIELVMGVSPRGSYCRDLLDTSRMLDLYALLGLPIQTTLAYPSSETSAAHADPDQRINLGHWRDGFAPATQADWTAAFAALTLCKPYVRGVQWSHWSDAKPHAFPHCGLIDEQGQEKPVLKLLRDLRTAHLK